MKPPAADTIVAEEVEVAVGVIIKGYSDLLGLNVRGFRPLAFPLLGCHPFLKGDLLDVLVDKTGLFLVIVSTLYLLLHIHDGLKALGNSLGIITAYGIETADVIYTPLEIGDVLFVLYLLLQYLQLLGVELYRLPGLDVLADVSIHEGFNNTASLVLDVLQTRLDGINLLLDSRNLGFIKGDVIHG